MKPHSILLVTALTSVLASGCASIEVVERPVVARKVGQEPEVGRTATAPVGGPIYSQYRYWSKSGYRLSSPVGVGFMLGRIAANAGDSLALATVNGKAVYCTEFRAYIDPFTGPHKPACFIDSDQSGMFTQVTAAPGSIWIEKELPAPVSYEKAEHLIPRADSFKYELLYQGLSNRTLRLSYREFANDLARPAFFQDVSYDLTELPATVTFRSVRIEVLSADNNGLTYRVLSGF